MTPSTDTNHASATGPLDDDSNDSADVETWISAGPINDYPINASKVVKHNQRKICVFQASEGSFYALDDQCPHEGYPLSKGALCGKTLTCCYHNFKFDLTTGQCLKGDENVQVYPTRIRDGLIEIGVRSPKRDTALGRYQAGLFHALHERKMGQAAREVVRMLALGEPAQNILWQILSFDSNYAEYGSTHTLAVAADMLVFLQHHQGTDLAIPIMQVAELASETSVRRAKRPSADPCVLPKQKEQAISALLLAIENEEVVSAEAMLKGMIQNRYGRNELQDLLYSVCTKHFLGFGHGLIYVNKAFDLLDAVGFDKAEELLPALLVGLIYQNRDDVLPEWTWYRKRIHEVQSHLEDWYNQQRDTVTTRLTETEKNQLFHTLLNDKREEPFDQLANYLDRGVSLSDLVGVICEAAAERVLRFDVSIDSTPTIQDGWLDVTHVFTFANAVRHAVKRYRNKESLLFLFQAARFISESKPLDSKTPIVLSTNNVSHLDEEGTLVALEEAIVSKSTGHALCLTYHYITSQFSIQRLQQLCEKISMRDHCVRPIIIAHLIKMCQAAFDEYSHRSTSSTRQHLALLALVKLFSSPIQERQIHRMVHEAIRFVEHGKVPYRLTP